MGNNPSLPVVTDVVYNRNFSQQHNVSEWTKFRPKNDDYYNGSRFFRVSRSLYPYYNRGLLWGYSIDYKWKKYEKAYKCTDCGKESKTWCENSGSCVHCAGAKEL